MSRPAVDLPSPTDLLPHGEGAVLLDRIVQFDDGSIECELTVDSRCPYLANERVDSLVSLELVAQAAAAHRALLALARSGAEQLEPRAAVRSGALVAAPSVVLHDQAMSRGARVSVRARCTLRHGATARYDGQVFEGKRLVAECTLTVQESPAEPPSGAK